MKVNLYTDAPKHNLALMKLSAWHKANGDEVTLNMPIMPCDYSYASILFEKNRNVFHADEYGGPAFNDECLPEHIEKMKPDYDLFPTRNILNYHGARHIENNHFSLGYTYRPCFRKCPFCKVPEMKQPNKEHHSIWEFHDPKFKYIRLLNNNTFFDSQWRETFHEIWDAGLIVIDENGYDLRLMDEEKAEYLRKTNFHGEIHYAWDRMQDEMEVLEGLNIAPSGSVYVLIGYDTTEEEDFYRCQKIVDFGHHPYIMPYHQNKKEKRFKRFIDSFMWRKYPTIEQAWKEYK